MQENIYLEIVNKENVYQKSKFNQLDYIYIFNTQMKQIQIEQKTYTFFLKLKEFCENNLNIKIGVKYAYHSEKEQEKLFIDFCKKYGKTYAEKIVCPVGASEHHIGLAIDIEVFINNNWISNNEQPDISYPILEKIHPYLQNYGFVLRYPNTEKGKELTKIPYEPWHFRYVGIKVAEYLTEHHMVLEELKNNNIFKL